MRQFRRVNLDGKGGDIIQLDGKGEAIFEHKAFPSETGVKPVPAHPEEATRYTRPQSLFASDEPDPYKYANKGERWTTRYTRPGESEPSEFAHKASEWPSRYTRADEPEPSEFTWKFSRQSFKSDIEREPSELIESEWPTKLKSRR